MNSWVLLEYRRLRHLGWRGIDALRAARIDTAFSDSENQGLVKVELEPDDPSIALDGDFDERTLKKLRERVNNEGSWYLQGYARLSEDDAWERIDGIGGFIGDDWQDSGYDTDVKQSCLEWLDDARQQEANELATRATFAGLSV